MKPQLFDDNLIQPSSHTWGHAPDCSHGQIEFEQD